MLGKDSFQEIDITGITMPITKHNYIVKDVNDLADTIRKAFDIARSGRPGPVLIDIPKDVTAEKAEYIKTEPIMTKKSNVEIKEEDIDLAVSMIEKSEKPFIFVGGGTVISKANPRIDAICKFGGCHRLQILMGKRSVP